MLDIRAFFDSRDHLLRFLEQNRGQTGSPADYHERRRRKTVSRDDLQGTPQARWFHPSSPTSTCTMSSTSGSRRSGAPERLRGTLSSCVTLTTQGGRGSVSTRPQGAPGSGARPASRQDAPHRVRPVATAHRRARSTGDLRFPSPEDEEPLRFGAQTDCRSGSHEPCGSRSDSAAVARRRHETAGEGGQRLAELSVPTSSRTLGGFVRRLEWIWLATLRRRSQRTRTTVTRLTALYWPPARVRHPWPNARFAVNHPR